MVLVLRFRMIRKILHIIILISLVFQGCAGFAAGVKETGGLNRLGYSIQVGAFKDRSGADGVMQRLKERGYPAYVVPPADPAGLFNVRVGSFTARADAERIQARLRDEEKYKPFIVKQ